jgi:hypothetical protein
MAQLAGTTDVYDIKGVREDLQDAIYSISKADTPFISNIGRGKAKSTLHEWQIDALATADANNAQIEGDEFAYTDRAATTRVGNRTQISRKTILISGTAEAVDKAGRKSEMKYQAMKAGKELKRDMEAILLANQASLSGNATTARKLGGFPAWLTTNVSRGATGANGGFNQGTGLVVAKTNGTNRAWTEAMLKDVHQSAYQAGGNPSIAMMPVAQKRVFSGFAGIAQQRRETGNKAATIIAAADVYVGDFGSLSAVPNRQYTAGEVFLIDPTMAKLRYLRPMQIKKPAQTGDAEKRVLLTEYTLEVSNEAAHGTISDLS